MFIMRYLFVLLLFICFGIHAQNIKINEVVSSNSEYTDEDGDTPDWFELHNPGSVDVSIDGWFISDDPDEFDKWAFPNITLAPRIWFHMTFTKETTYTSTTKTVLLKKILQTSI